MGLILLGALLALEPADAADCSQWGQISSEDPVELFLNETETFSIFDDAACGDSEGCTWWLDEDMGLGALDTQTGSVVVYLAPSSLVDCNPVSFDLNVSCVDGPTSDAVTLTLMCSDAELQDLADAEVRTMSGGGCGSPSMAFLFLPLIGVGVRRR